MTYQYPDPLRVLVACEYSGVVRDAFAARGWDAWSCDLEPPERPEGNHYQGDVLDLLYSQHWDLMIGHPPCTYLTNSGVRWLTDPRPQFANRWDQLEDGAKFFRLLLEAPVKFKAIENPRMHRYAIERIGRKQDQIIQPWQFGHLESKGTGLWLENLPLLQPVTDLKAEMDALPKSETHKVHYASPGPNRWKERSRTFQGIGDAMAEQWGRHVETVTMTQ